MKTLQPFCIVDPGELHLCGPLGYAKYELQIALIENEAVRSRASFTITVNNARDDEPVLCPETYVGHILENSPIHTAIMKLCLVENDVSGKQPSLNFRILDREMSQVFNKRLI